MEGLIEGHAVLKGEWSLTWQIKLSFHNLNFSQQKDVEEMKLKISKLLRALPLLW